MARLKTGPAALVILSLACALALQASSTMLTAAQAVKPLQVQELNQASIVGEVIECKRSNGVLTVRLGLRNTSTKPIAFYVISSRNYDQYYVTADTKKYLILRDSEGAPLSVPGDASGNVYVTVPGGERFTWWAKYPAPPASVTKVNLFTPLAPPFDDIPISDQ